MNLLVLGDYAVKASFRISQQFRVSEGFCVLVLEWFTRWYGIVDTSLYFHPFLPLILLFEISDGIHRQSAWPYSCMIHDFPVGSTNQGESIQPLLVPSAKYKDRFGEMRSCMVAFFLYPDLNHTC